MGQCCTARTGSASIPSDGHPERWGGAANGAYSSSEKIPTVRLLTHYSAKGRNGCNLYLGNALAGKDQKLMGFHRIKRRIQVCTKGDLGESSKWTKTPKSKDPRILLVTVCPVRHTNLEDQIEECVQFIRDSSNASCNLLIHSLNPKHVTEAWSIAVACGCLMKIHSWTLEHALNAIKVQSPDVELSFEHGMRLQEFEKGLNLTGDGGGGNGSNQTTTTTVATQEEEASMEVDKTPEVGEVNPPSARSSRG